MTIATYSDLKTAIETWMARVGDTQISANAADLVTLASSRLNRDLPLRTMRTSTTLTGSLGSRSLTLPSDYVEPISLLLTTFGVQTMLSPRVAGEFEYGTYNGVPATWAINGSTIDLDVPCDQAHTFVFWYRQSFSLSDAVTTNWLLTNHPDCYLFACLVEAGTFVQDGGFATGWEARLQAAMASIAEKDARGIALATLRVDPALMAHPGFNIYTG